MLSPVARQALTEVNTYLLLDSGTVSETGLERSADGGMSATWQLTWPEQQVVRASPIMLHAYFGASFHHPHLRGATVGDWPLNVLSVQDATDQLPTLRAIATADLHNLVFQADYRNIPVVTTPSSDRSSNPNLD